ncbi:MAG: sulfatase-like hydrolase/transferase [Kiritimatiellia bacterium]
MNIILIHTDQQRYDSLGCTGNRYAVTPNLDRLGAEGTVFHRHISAHPVCMPSRSSLLSGLYPLGHGVASNGIALARREAVPHKDRWSHYVFHVETLADMLAREGYHTRSIGKLHLTPTQSHIDLGYEECHDRWVDRGMEGWHGPYYGFEYVDATLHHGEGVFGHYRYWLEDEHPEVLEAISAPDRRKEQLYGNVPDIRDSVIPEEAHHSTWIGDRAVEFLSNRDDDRPFFLFLGFPDPHHPFTPPESLGKEFRAHDVMPHAGIEQMTGGRPWAWEEFTSSRKKDSEKKGDENAMARVVRQQTDAMVHLIDRSVGRVLDALESKGLEEDTIVVFTSDHGDYLGDFGLLRKRELGCNALCRIPFIIRIPGMDLPGETSVPMSNVDVVPTLMSALGFDVPGSLHGRDILPLVRTGNFDHTVMVQAVQNSLPGSRNLSLFDARYRFTWYPVTDERELYDHDADPMELHNLAEDPGYAERCDGMLARLIRKSAEATQACTGRVSSW